MKLQYESGDTRGWQFRHYTAGKAASLLPFALNDFGKYVCDRHYRTEREGFAQFLFLGTHSGCGELHTAGKKVLLPAGKAAVFDCDPYQCYGTAGDAWDFSWFHFTGTAAHGFVRFLNGTGLQVLDWDPARSPFEELRLLTELPTRETDLQVSLWIHDLLSSLAAAAAPLPSDPEAEQIAAAAAYLRKNYVLPLNVEEIARQYHLSKFHFIRTFRRFTGRTPYEYLILARIDGAKQLLAGTSLPVSESAAQTGFGDSKALIRSFRQHTGMTPAGFRKQTPSFPKGPGPN